MNDQSSLLHGCRSSKETPWSHWAVVDSVNADSKVATVFLLTSFKAKSGGIEQSLLDAYSSNSEIVRYERKKYLLIDDANNSTERYNNPDTLVPALKLEGSDKLPRASYVNVQKTYKVEFKHLDWPNNMPHRSTLKPEHVSNLKHCADIYSSFVAEQLQILKAGLRQHRSWP